MSLNIFLWVRNPSLKQRSKKVPKPKQNKFSLKFSISKVIGRNFLKCSSGKIHDEIIKKGNPAKENIYKYISLST